MTFNGCARCKHKNGGWAIGDGSTCDRCTNGDLYSQEYDPVDVPHDTATKKPNRGKQVMYDNKRYVPYDKGMLRRLGPLDTAIVGTLIDIDDANKKDGKFSITSETLGKMIKVSYKTINRHIDDIQKEFGFFETDLRRTVRGTTPRSFTMNYDKIREFIHRAKEEDMKLSKKKEDN
jgi:hypothetical protein